jgi:hypothetical protein
MLESRHREERSDAAIQSHRRRPTSLDRFAPLATTGVGHSPTSLALARNLFPDLIRRHRAGLESTISSAHKKAVLRCFGNPDG